VKVLVFWWSYAEFGTVMMKENCGKLDDYSLAWIIIYGSAFLAILAAIFYMLITLLALVGGSVAGGGGSMMHHLERRLTQRNSQYFDQNDEPTHANALPN